jgi:glycosyltransferase involved in cell wall biosynthesis
MRIAIDGRALTGRYTGDRTYWRSLLRALPNVSGSDTYTVYSRLPIPEGELPEAPNVTTRRVNAPDDRLWTLAALPLALRKERPDLLHVQYTTPLPGLCPCPVVTTVHDISFRLFPHWFPRRDRILLNMTVPVSMRRARRVITDSESSRRDLLRVYGLPADKVVGIPLGLPEGFAPFDPRGEDRNEQECLQQIANMKYGFEGPFVLAVGVFQPRKNLRVLAEAFGRAKSKYHLPHRLVLVGKAGWGTEQEALRQAAGKGGGTEAAEALLFPGYVDDADLPLLYQSCAAFAHPALYEGFGIPPLEAMACGAPCLVSDAPAMPEVAGDAALIVPASDVEAWTEALGRVLTDTELRRSLAARGPMRAADFPWKVTAERTHAVYQEAIDGDAR